MPGGAVGEKRLMACSVSSVDYPIVSRWLNVDVPTNVCHCMHVCKCPAACNAFLWPCSSSITACTVPLSKVDGPVYSLATPSNMPLVQLFLTLLAWFSLCSIFTQLTPQSKPTNVVSILSISILSISGWIRGVLQASPSASLFLSGHWNFMPCAVKLILLERLCSFKRCVVCSMASWCCEEQAQRVIGTAACIHHNPHVNGVLSNPQSSWWFAQRICILLCADGYDHS
jgi:hypothetical protein